MLARLFTLGVLLSCTVAHSKNITVTGVRLEELSVVIDDRQSNTPRDSGTVTVRNLESVPVRVTFEVSSGPFSVAASSWSLDIAANSWKTTKVYYGPSSAGAHRGTLNVIDEDTIVRRLPVLGEASIGDMLSYNGMIEFNGLTTLEKLCIPVVFNNTTSEAISITQVDGNLSSVMHVEGVPPLPVVLLPGEHFVAFELCVEAPNPAYGDGHGSVLVVYDQGGVAGKRNEVYAMAKLVPDSNLTKPCVSASLESPYLGRIVVGGNITGRLVVRSNRYEPITIDTPSITGFDTANFSVLTASFPLTIPPLASITLPITYSPPFSDSLVEYRHTSYLNFDAEHKGAKCLTVKTSLIGIAIAPTDTSTAAPLISDQQHLLTLVGNNGVGNRRFHFYNNTGTTFRIIGVSLGNAKSFSITAIAPTTLVPFELAPGERMSVDIALVGNESEVYYDELLIQTNKVNGEPERFPIQGVILPSASLGRSPKKELPAKIHVDLSTATLIVQWPKAGMVDILDILGRQVVSSVFSYSWNYPLARLDRGSYILRLSSGQAVWSKLFIRD